MKRSSYFLAIICVVLIFQSTLHAQEPAKRPFVPDDLSRFENIQTYLSPDGGNMLYVHSRRGDANASDIWLVPTNGTPRRKILSGTYSLFSWSPDGRRLAYLAHKGPLQ